MFWISTFSFSAVFQTKTYSAEIFVGNDFKNIALTCPIRGQTGFLNNYSCWGKINKV